LHLKWTGIIDKKFLNVKCFFKKIKKSLFLSTSYYNAVKKCQGTHNMKILLAPSESKKSGGEEAFKLEALLFDTLLPYRAKLLHTYINILQKQDMAELSAMFGLKKEADIKMHIKDIIHEPAMKAIERYTGVAFDHLNYFSLSPDAQNYVDKHVILCSNLFGFLRADDMIPEYRLKQGASVGDIKVEKYYQEHGAALMEAYLKDEDILDVQDFTTNSTNRPSPTLPSSSSRRERWLATGQKRIVVLS